MRYLLIFLLAIFLTTTACAPQPPASSQAVINIHLTQIIDKATRQPLPDCTITLFWEAENGEIIDRQEYKKQPSLEATVPTDGKTRLWITVTAPGYETWENAFRARLNDSRPMEFPVEMEKRVTLEVHG